MQEHENQDQCDAVSTQAYENLLEEKSRLTALLLQARHDLSVALRAKQRYRGIAYDLARKHEPDYHQLHEMLSEEEQI